MAIEAHDFVSTSPTNVFATMNVLNLTSSSTLTDGNLKCNSVGTNIPRGSVSTIAMPNTGVYYIEFRCNTALDNLSRFTIGLTPDLTVARTTQGYVLSTNTSYLYSTRTNVDVGFKILSTFDTSSSAAPAYSSGMIIQVLYDASNNKIWFGKNNTWYGSSGALSSPNFSTDQTGSVASNIDLFFTVEWASEVGTALHGHVNFGQDSSFGGNVTSGSAEAPGGNGIGDFYYDPPTASGTKALALCTANIQSSLAIDPAVDDLPEDHFKCLIWTGDNAGQRDIPHNMPTAPDLVWIKNRSDGGYGHTIFDSVRGYGANEIQSSGTSAQGAYSGSYGYVDSVDNTNIKLTDGNAAGYSDRKYTNYSGNDYIAWCWKAGGAPSGATSAIGSAKRINSSGTQDDTSCSALATAATSAGASNVITPTFMSINQKAGFSIIKYSGTGSNATIPHGLSSAPEFFIVKCTSQSDGWFIYNKNIGAANYLRLDQTIASSSAATLWNSTDPSATVINIGTNGGVNGVTSGTGRTYIMYAFTSVEGYSAFGSVANLNNDEFVYLGFKPAWVMFKRTTDTSNWTIYDNARNPHNVCDKLLNADTANAESTYASLDLLSNGFKARSFSGASGEWVYMAFAEMPFKYAATNAR